MLSHPDALGSASDDGGIGDEIMPIPRMLRQSGSLCCGRLPTAMLPHSVESYVSPNIVLISMAVNSAKTLEIS
jgi:hypothetical protein